MCGIGPTRLCRTNAPTIVCANSATAAQRGATVRERDCPQATATTKPKHNCASAACTTASDAGSTHFTSSAPTAACANTVPSAAHANFVRSRNASPATINVTTKASARCANSYRIFASSGGMSRPQLSGQSGIEPAASLLVTSAPATTSAKVQHATSTG